MTTDTQFGLAVFGRFRHLVVKLAHVKFNFDRRSTYIADKHKVVVLGNPITTVSKTAGSDFKL